MGKLHTYKGKGALAYTAFIKHAKLFIIANFFIHAIFEFSKSTKSEKSWYMIVYGGTI